MLYRRRIFAAWPIKHLWIRTGPTPWLSFKRRRAAQHSRLREVRSEGLLKDKSTARNAKSAKVRRDISSPQRSQSTQRFSVDSLSSYFACFRDCGPCTAGAAVEADSHSAAASLSSGTA